MTSAAKLDKDIKRILANPRRPPLFTSRARGRKRKTKNPIHVSTQDKRRLGLALRSKSLSNEERKVLRKLDRNINVQLTDLEMDHLRSAAASEALPSDQRFTLSSLIAHQFNNGRGL